VGKQQITLTVDGQAHTLRVGTDARLLDVLRDQLSRYGTKEGCASGECGACSVIMDGRLVDSCMVFAVQADGADIVTIEGLGTSETLHPIQEAFLDSAAVQCGFCAPGMVLAAKVLLDHNPDPTEDEIRQAMAGNICRCTGYTKIVEAVQLASARMKGV
jgi:carbon-monoxide dehydrogenase small subunit